MLGPFAAGPRTTEIEMIGRWSATNHEMVGSRNGGGPQPTPGPAKGFQREAATTLRSTKRDPIAVFLYRTF